MTCWLHWLKWARKVTSLISLTLADTQFPASESFSDVYFCIQFGTFWFLSSCLECNSVSLFKSVFSHFSPPPRMLFAICLFVWCSFVPIYWLSVTVIRKLSVQHSTKKLNVESIYKKKTKDPVQQLCTVSTPKDLTEANNAKTTWPIITKFDGNVAHEPRKNSLDSDGNLDHVVLGSGLG